ncbi:MAG: sugar transferase [Bacteroidales bacterium]|nr:sugar transferase [Bacteroidales bacterium]
MNRRSFILIIIDILFVLTGFWLGIKINPVSFSADYVYYELYLVLGLFWIMFSFLFNKYNFKKVSITEDTKQVFLSNISLLMFAIFILYLMPIDKNLDFIVFATIVFASFLEFSFLYFGYLFKRVPIIQGGFYIPETDKKKIDIHEYRFKSTEKIPESVIIYPRKELSVKNAIIQELGESAYCFFEKAVNISLESTLIISTTTRFNIMSIHDNFYKAIINIKRVNDIQRINKFFETVNEKLPKSGIFICMAETKDLRKKRILAKFPPVFNYIYYSIDFLIKRVFPKFPITKKIYFLLTRGENRVLSRAELLGRLYSCGFEIVEEEYIDNRYFVVARKIKTPAFDLEPSYGPIIKLKRVGKGGKLIKVYKMRTMHPYAEYLQGYVYEKNDLQEGGKFNNDFRVSTLGRFMRKFWIDELPMFVNFFRGDMKLFGVRPLSQHYFNLYSQELQEKRIKFKPGLIPPFYVDNPKTLEEIMASEMKYLEAYEKSPFWTDFKYFFIAFYNIAFKRYRSK